MKVKFGDDVVLFRVSCADLEKERIFDDLDEAKLFAQDYSLRTKHTVFVRPIFTVYAYSDGVLF